jgi:hypothetical protein
VTKRNMKRKIRLMLHSKLMVSRTSARLGNLPSLTRISLSLIPAAALVMAGGGAHASLEVFARLCGRAVNSTRIAISKPDSDAPREKAANLGSAMTDG